MIGLKNKSGFTLLELLIAISIFAILTSLIGISYRSNEELRQLKNQAQSIVDGLQKAQNMSLAGESVLVNGNPTVPNYYRFSLIKDNNVKCHYLITAFAADGSALKEIARVNFEKLLINVTASAPLNADFYPPRGKMALSLGGAPSQTEYKLQLKNPSISDIFCVTVNSISGRMDIAAGQCQ